MISTRLAATSVLGATGVAATRACRPCAAVERDLRPLGSPTSRHISRSAGRDLVERRRRLGRLDRAGLDLLVPVAEAELVAAVVELAVLEHRRLPGDAEEVADPRELALGVGGQVLVADGVAVVGLARGLERLAVALDRSSRVVGVLALVRLARARDRAPGGGAGR